MTDESQTGNEFIAPKKVGERLAEARRAAGFELSDIATRTRIPLRHLEALEEGRYSDLPAVTYCSGFTKAYARTLDLDEAAFARDIRIELDKEGSVAEPQYFEPADPARVPPRALAWTGVVLAILIVGGFAVYRFGVLDGLRGHDPVSIAAQTDALENGDAGQVTTEPGNIAVATPPAAPVAATGQVVLTATENVWLRIYDGTGTRLFEKEMQPGEVYQVPADANNPQILTGRPQALKVTVGGQEVAPLGPPERSIKDVGISAAALAARPPAVNPALAGASGTPINAANPTSASAPIQNAY